MLLVHSAHQENRGPESRRSKLKDLMKGSVSGLNAFATALPLVIKEVYEADSVSLWSHDPVNQRLIHLSSAGIDTTKIDQFVLDTRQAPCGLCVEHKRFEANIHLPSGIKGRTDQHQNLTSSLGHVWMTSVPILNLANPNQVLQVINLMSKNQLELSNSDLLDLASFCGSRYERLLHESCFRQSNLLQFELSANAIGGDLRGASRRVANHLQKCTDSEAAIVFVRNSERELSPMGLTIRSIEKIRDSFPHIFQIAEETVSGNREKNLLPQKKGTLECSLISVPIRDFEGRAVGAMVCIRQLEKKMAFTFDDITISEALGAVFATFYELLSSEEQRLSALGRLGHELRGPVTGMRAAIAFARRSSSVPPSLERYLRDLSSYTQTMTDVLSNIEIATEERLSEKFSKEPVHLVNDLIAPAMAAIKESLPGRGIHESSIRRPGLSNAPRMNLDKARMMQVVFNLLENAVKYSASSSPAIRIDVTFEKRDSRYEISFRDRGIGVPEGYEERIFLMGVRAPNTIDKTATGKGYGLAISRKIVRAHGGDLIYRRHEEGSEFVIVLPESVNADLVGD